MLTSGLTFLTVLSLFVFGGEVLHGFLLCPRHRHPDRHLLVDRRRRSHARRLAGLARRQGQGRRYPAGRPPRPRLTQFAFRVNGLHITAWANGPAGAPGASGATHRSNHNELAPPPSGPTARHITAWAEGPGTPPTPSPSAEGATHSPRRSRPRRLQCRPAEPGNPPSWRRLRQISCTGLHPLGTFRFTVVSKQVELVSPKRGGLCLKIL